MAAYYNEIDKFAAAGLRALIEDGLIAPGDVDERPIQEVRPDDLRGYTQCHFFAGIGLWSVALRNAGWPDDRPVWTGSCPCQPFSAAGKKAAQSDERHLWPHWARLIRECQPVTLFGEQVASAIAYGWLDDVATDLEAEGYAFAASVLPACAAGAFHRRDRLWFVANASGGRCGKPREGKIQQSRGAETFSASNVVNTIGTRLEGHAGHEQGCWGGRRRTDQLPRQVPLAYAIGQRGCSGNSERENAENADTSSEGIEWLECPDGKLRPVKSGVRLLADGFPCRIPLLRAAGNAIDPRPAQKFIEAARECIDA